jgi:hypothetical protein
MYTLTIGIIIFVIIAYIIFVTRTNKLYSAIKKIVSGKSERVIIKQSLEQIRAVVNAQFKRVMSTDKTILFEYNSQMFIVSPLSQNEVLVSFMPSDEELQEFIELEDDIENLQTSKEDKKAEEVVAELRQVISRYYDGNIVYELAKILGNRYKLTVSTYETIMTQGILPGTDGSGGVAVAISKNEILFLTYDPHRQETKMQLGIYPNNMLIDIEKNLIRDNEIAKYKEGAIYKNYSDIQIFIGAITLLGYEVGIGRDEGNLFPFKYKNNNFVIVAYMGDIWIVYEED